ncbi:hypothetical protein WG66_016625 [Moniliophthora roreri]|nr:hypothetical protein WG66_016625 [Moniliophthora roreri]
MRVWMLVEILTSRRIYIFITHSILVMSLQLHSFVFGVSSKAEEPDARYTYQRNTNLSFTLWTRTFFFSGLVRRSTVSQGETPSGIHRSKWNNHLCFIAISRLQETKSHDMGPC